jgi:hypothetical protein
LIQNMNKRCFEVIRLQGNKTKYWCNICNEI